MLSLHHLAVVAHSQTPSCTPPHTGLPRELDHWRQRVAELEGLQEQLRAPSARSLVAAAAALRVPEHEQWKAVEGRVGDALSGASDCAKYLAMLLRSAVHVFSGMLIASRTVGLVLVLLWLFWWYSFFYAFLPSFCPVSVWCTVVSSHSPLPSHNPAT